MNLEPGVRGRDYETSQLIPYLGNKRALIPKLRGLFGSLMEERKSTLFLDPFAGAGSVSRLARTMGMRVRANDWEPYAYVLNRCWLTLSRSDLSRMFQERGGMVSALSRINSFHPLRQDFHPDPEPEPYMARWYAPRDTERADWRTERLFYTRENAVFLDRAREEIARLGPWDEPGEGPCGEACLLLALLVLEAATHANTSGVFKAFHKGFGGYGRDALNRILGAMELEAPILPEAEKAEVYHQDAVLFVRRFSADLAYLDPPYNQHQYGSNYHLLNSLVRWDRCAVPLDIGDDGRLVRKAGISESWKETWSGYCGRGTARSTLTELIDNLDVRTVVLSYNTEGIIPSEEILENLSRRWDVQIEILDYVQYRGGRQSSSRRVRNHELVYVGKPRCRAVNRDPEPARRRLLSQIRLRRLLAARYDPERIRRTFPLRGDAVDLGEGLPSLAMWRLYRFSDAPVVDIAPSRIPDWDLAMERLETCEIRDNEQAVCVLAGIAETCMLADLPGAIPEARKAAREALTALRKLAHPKYLEEYRKAEELLARLAKEHPPLAGFLDRGLRALSEQRAARLGGG